MKPIYFPFTHVSNPVAQALTACFGQFIVYRPVADKMPEPMQFWVEKGILNVRVPVTEGEKELETTVKDFLHWANLHIDDSGFKAPLLKTWKGSIPFYHQSSSSQIVADIKELIHGSSTVKVTEPVLAARIFLYFAQEFDRQNQAVTHDLKLYHQKEEDMMRELKMENGSLTGTFQKEGMDLPDASANYMPLDRLEAWTRIYLKDTETSGLFITHSPAILQELLERSPTAEKILQLESIPACEAMNAEFAPWQQRLMSDLSHIVEYKWMPRTGGLFDRPGFAAAENTVSLSVYLVPDQKPRNFFSRCAQIEPYDSDMPDAGNRFKNTLISLVEFYHPKN